MQSGGVSPRHNGLTAVKIHRVSDPFFCNYLSKQCRFNPLKIRVNSKSDIFYIQIESMQKLFNICTLSAKTLADFSEALRTALTDLGCVAHYIPATVAENATNIFVDSCLLQDWSLVPPNSILYNLEQLGSGSPLASEAYIEKLSRHEVWDYSIKNIEYLKQRGIRHAKYVPIGFCRSFCRPSLDLQKDIDVLFYGAPSERRKRICDEIKRFARLVSVTGVYGEELWKLIARAKVVLNLHSYPTNIFEAVRVSYLLANKKAVLSEVNADTDLPVHYAGAICSAPYELIPEICIRLLQNEPHRRYLEEVGHKIFLRSPMSSLLPIK
jgi:hypothetical protein